MLVKLQAKECKTFVTYKKPNKTIYDNSIELNKNNKEVFQILNPHQEVKHENLNLKQNKKINQWIKSLMLSASSFLVAIPVSAQGTSSVIADLPSQTDLMEIAQWAIGYSTKSIVLFGVVWIVVTRVLQFPAIKKYRDMALEIATNTIKGITEAILIPTLIAIIIGISVLLFGDIGIFHLPL